MEIISLILIAAIWAGTHAIMLGYSGLNMKRDAIVTGRLNGAPIDAAYRKHLFTNDWLPLKFGLGLVSMIFVAVIASIPLLVSEEERTGLIWALALGVALFPLYNAYGWLVRGLYDYQFIKDVLKKLEKGGSP